MINRKKTKIKDNLLVCVRAEEKNCRILDLSDI